MGKRPYNGRSRREIRDQILSKQAYIRPDSIPRGWTKESVDFINRLIQRKPYKRLGMQGIQELKQHGWFDGFDWDSLKKKKMVPPFTPNIKNVFEYLRNLTEDFTQDDQSLENLALVKKKTFQDMFEEYDCYPQSFKDIAKGNVPEKLCKKTESSKETRKQEQANCIKSLLRKKVQLSIYIYI